MYRRGMAYKALDDFENASKDFAEVLRLEKKNADATRELDDVMKKLIVQKKNGGVPKTRKQTELKKEEPKKIVELPKKEEKKPEPTKQSEPEKKKEAPKKVEEIKPKVEEMEQKSNPT